MDQDSLLAWLAQHREVLTWLGGGVATVAGGAWMVIRAWMERRGRSGATPAAPAGPAVSVGTGIAAGGNLRIDGPVTIQQTRLPPGAIALLALGLVLLGVALWTGGERIEVRNGAYVGGSMQGSTVIIAPGGAAR